MKRRMFLTGYEKRSDCLFHGKFLLLFKAAFYIEVISSRKKIETNIISIIKYSVWKILKLNSESFEFSQVFCVSVFCYFSSH